MSWFQCLTFWVFNANYEVSLTVRKNEFLIFILCLLLSQEPLAKRGRNKIEYWRRIRVPCRVFYTPLCPLIKPRFFALTTFQSTLMSWSCYNNLFDMICHWCSACRVHTCKWKSHMRYKWRSWWIKPNSTFFFFFWKNKIKFEPNANYAFSSLFKPSNPSQISSPLT